VRWMREAEREARRVDRQLDREEAEAAAATGRAEPGEGAGTTGLSGTIPSARQPRGATGR